MQEVLHIPQHRVSVFLEGRHRLVVTGKAALGEGRTTGIVTHVIPSQHMHLEYRASGHPPSSLSPKRLAIRQDAANTARPDNLLHSSFWRAIMTRPPPTLCFSETGSRPLP